MSVSVTWRREASISLTVLCNSLGPKDCASDLVSCSLFVGLWQQRLGGAVGLGSLQLVQAAGDGVCSVVCCRAQCKLVLLPVLGWAKYRLKYTCPYLIVQYTVHVLYVYCILYCITLTDILKSGFLCN